MKLSHSLIGLSFLLLAACTGGSPTAVYINEICGKDSAAGDWIELYNPSNLPVDLSGYYLLKTDEDGLDFTLYEFPDGQQIGAGEFLVVSQLADDLERKISHKKEVGIELVNRHDKTVDQFYRDDEVGDTAHPVGGSYARQSDGTGPWHIAKRATPGESNS